MDALQLEMFKESKNSVNAKFRKEKHAKNRKDLLSSLPKTNNTPSKIWIASWFIWRKRAEELNPYRHPVRIYEHIAPRRKKNRCFAAWHGGRKELWIMNYELWIMNYEWKIMNEPVLRLWIAPRFIWGFLCQSVLSVSHFCFPQIAQIDVALRKRNNGCFAAWNV